MKYNKNIKGFLDIEEGIALYNIALKASILGPCLEIGSYCGKTSIFIGSACKENSSVLFSIDHHKGSEEHQKEKSFYDPTLIDKKTSGISSIHFFTDNIYKANLQKNIIPIINKSTIVSKKWKINLGMLFIDGSHSYNNVFNDYYNWYKLICCKGYLVFHDIFKDQRQGGGNPLKIYKLAIKSGIFVELKMVKTLGILYRYK